MAVDAVSPADPSPAWLRAVLDLAVLAVLVEGDRHGYALAQRLAEHGIGPVRGGALYPVLGRLETEATVSSRWQPGEGGPGRKVYAVTEAGRVRLATDGARWRDFTATLGQLLLREPGAGVTVRRVHGS